ncbi:beta-ketoacyl-ACP synthase III [Loigolactobacillus backii]|uniref:Beta-ketoacyl-[acyl-carrier-protein] synthase III n=1 Tax=Loigolactobacillus backii TaxID=375175 RepID=A0A192H0W6_9LACO|nr:beta-ketoacyl-ACP synthase III [Loigolactobacillus backii]ANK59065.1 3-oxoacyl-ACP synthase [Loigolactobacillus backii]ANK62444.1 3-oxoacyl-ACP synthase [Loigolactobacillus backii]ANK67552.1 3-oxoacyl-ACP synthase [Loigolactobacillus backii]ANK70544.1 3-oxoacyl-ACP synthase [Loigolactobacillus backii]MDA5387537.1 ketoacyl-ACP synthase III [Loigolactobacillus backii]
MANYVTIDETAHYVPEKVVTNDELAALMPTSDAWIQSHTGIKTRHIALEQNTSDLAAKVATKLLQQANLAATDIDLIIVSTITPDYLTPATACLMQDKVGATNAVCFDISAACAGFIFAASTAEKFLRRGQFKHALVISAETNSKMMDWQDRTTTVFFGDGAGGALLSQTADASKESFLAEQLENDGRQHEVIESGAVKPLSTISATHRPEIAPFKMQGRAVFDFATTAVPKQIQQLLTQQHLTADDVDLFVCHQANLRIIEGIAAKLMQPMTKFPVNVSEYGNTSSAGVPMALDQALQHQFTGKIIVLSGFGGGLAYGSLLIRL